MESQDSATFIAEGERVNQVAQVSHLQSGAGVGPSRDKYVIAMSLSVKSLSVNK